MNPKNVQSSRCKHTIPLRIIFRLFLVNFAVHFYHQPSGMAVKIYDESVDDLLTPEMKTMQSVSAKTLPKHTL